MEEVELRGWIDKLQMRLQTCSLESAQQLQTVLESLVMKKQGLCEMLQHWNGRSVEQRGAGGRSFINQTVALQSDYGDDTDASTQ